VDPGCNASAGKTVLSVARPADPPTEFRIERCQVDVDACLDLCTFVAAASTQSQVSFELVTACTAQFDGDTKVKLDITYTNNDCLENGGPAGLDAGGAGGGGGGGI
jgi:hypothetical protein